MANKTSIEWTDFNWNFLRGCSRVSEGCRNCYAEGVAARFSKPGQPYEGLAKFWRRESDAKTEARWTGEISFIEDVLMQPLRWKKPRKIFVNSMSDLFHEKVQDEWLDRAFAVMALTPQHTYQILTKRPERMKEYFADSAFPWLRLADDDQWSKTPGLSMNVMGWAAGYGGDVLENVHLGVSVEDQKTADERIPLLLDTPAAVRWISAEPLLGPVNLERYLFASGPEGEPAPRNEPMLPCLHWVVCGGESGPNARPFDVAWCRSIIKQCKDAGVPVFVKQMGANVWDRNDAGFEGDYPHEWPMDTETDDWHLDPSRQYQGAMCRVMLGDRKGGNTDEWPEDLRIREFPK